MRETGQKDNVRGPVLNNDRATIHIPEQNINIFVTNLPEQKICDETEAKKERPPPLPTMLYRTADEARVVPLSLGKFSLSLDEDICEFR
jgi:hypothetical protein